MVRGTYQGDCPGMCLHVLQRVRLQFHPLKNLKLMVIAGTPARAACRGRRLLTGAQVSTTRLKQSNATI